MHIWSRKDAWYEAPGQCKIPIDMTQHDFRFRRNWFRNRNQTSFSTFLLPKFPADRPYKMLTIGVFEGAQEVWLMQNILKHPQSRLVCIDPWLATTKLDQEFMSQCKANAEHNLSPWQKQITLIQGFSQKVISDALDLNDFPFFGEVRGKFDLVIIDGDHVAEPVYQDAVLSYELAKPGGWLLFDDVRNDIPKKDHVADGLSRFGDEYSDRIRFAWAHRYCDCYEKV